ncbi:MAG: hypothetical protein K2X93_13320 [Candidatus Obscuribacterales bacterium]|nr:hypothetical protein [Candidatus Obscuribacterales bacterium]
MIKKVTLSLVATMLAGMTLVASSAPVLACDNNNLRGFNGNGNSRYYNATAAQNYLYNKNGFGFNNGFNNNYNKQAAKQARKLQHQQRKAARQLMQQQYAAYNGNNLYNNNGYYNNVNNPYLNQGLANAYLNNGNACSNDGLNGLNGLLNNGLNNNALYNAGLYGNGVSSLLGRVLNRL